MCTVLFQVLRCKEYKQFEFELSSILMNRIEKYTVILRILVGLILLIIKLKTTVSLFLFRIKCYGEYPLEELACHVKVWIYDLW